MRSASLTQRSLEDLSHEGLRPGSSSAPPPPRTSPARRIAKGSGGIRPTSLQLASNRADGTVLEPRGSVPGRAAVAPAQRLAALSSWDLALRRRGPWLDSRLA